MTLSGSTGFGHASSSSGTFTRSTWVTVGGGAETQLLKSVAQHRSHRAIGPLANSDDLCTDLLQLGYPDLPGCDFGMKGGGGAFGFVTQLRQCRLVFLGGRLPLDRLGAVEIGRAHV